MAHCSSTWEHLQTSLKTSIPGSGSPKSRPDVGYTITMHNIIWDGETLHWNQKFGLLSLDISVYLVSIVTFDSISRFWMFCGKPTIIFLPWKLPWCGYSIRCRISNSSTTMSSESLSDPGFRWTTPIHLIISWFLIAHWKLESFVEEMEHVVTPAKTCTSQTHHKNARYLYDSQSHPVRVPLAIPLNGEHHFHTSLCDFQ